MEFLAVELELSVEDVESLLVDMIMDSRIDARIDQITGLVTIGRTGRSDTKAEDDIMKTLSEWADTLGQVTESFVNRAF